MRNTTQRQLVLKIVNESMDHPTADKIYERARQVDPSISVGTVYRNLNLLSQLGEILHLTVPSGPDHYDFNLQDHYHFFCRRCHRVEDMKQVEVAIKTNAGALMPGYRLEGHKLIFFGLCPACIEGKTKEDTKAV
ncbi:MAG: transcriptional repressor [Clostridia bacterium]|nr:transcriptional repressor [Clostridia bacterium]